MLPIKDVCTISTSSWTRAIIETISSTALLLSRQPEMPLGCSLHAPKRGIQETTDRLSCAQGNFFRCIAQHCSERNNRNEIRHENHHRANLGKMHSDSDWNEHKEYIDVGVEHGCFELPHGSEFLLVFLQFRRVLSLRLILFCVLSTARPQSKEVPFSRLTIHRVRFGNGVALCPRRIGLYWYCWRVPALLRVYRRLSSQWRVSFDLVGGAQRHRIRM